MAYTNVWDASQPLGSQAANLIDNDIRGLKVDIAERMNTLFGTGAFTADPLTATQVALTGTASPKIIPGSTSIVFRNNADAATNLTIADAGQITIGRGDLLLDATTTARNLIINANAGQLRQLVFRTAGSNRWLLGVNVTAEGGGNAGSDFNIQRFDDTGALIGNIFTITRSTGAAAFIGSLTIGTGLTVSAGGAAITGNSTITGTATVTSTINGQTIGAPSSFTGAVTIATGLTVTAGGIAITAGSLTFGAAASKIIPGVTSLSLRNNADTQDNILITDAGVVTIRGGLTVSAGGIAVTGASTFSSTINGQTISASANFTGTVAISGAVTGGTYNSQTISAAADFTGTLNVATGYRIANAAASGNFLRGNGTNFVSSTIQLADLPIQSQLFKVDEWRTTGTVISGTTGSFIGKFGASTGDQAFNSFIADRAMEVRGITVRMTADRSAGSVTFTIAKNEVNTGTTLVIDGSNIRQNTATVAGGTITLAAGDRISITWSSTTYSPASDAVFGVEFAYT